MTNIHKNPFDANSPEWQLFENMVGSERLANVHDEDARRYALKASEARTKADKYREALAILGAAKKSEEGAK